MSASQSDPSFERSPLLINRQDSALVVVDVQQRLVPQIIDHERVVWNIVRLLRGAKTLGIKTIVTEQYPKGLGHTVEAIANELSETGQTSPAEKLMFSCRECHSLLSGLQDQGIFNLVVTGIESHVCVLQSVLDMIAMGFNVHVVVDAIGSRFDVDHETALCRLELSGATLVTTEMTLFEWCEVAGTAEFKKISQIVKESIDN